MRTRTTFTNKKNSPCWIQQNVAKGQAQVTDFFSAPAEVHTVTLGRIYDEYSINLREDWNFIGESDDWELLPRKSVAV